MENLANILHLTECLIRHKKAFQTTHQLDLISPLGVNPSSSMKDPNAAKYHCLTTLLSILVLSVKQFLVCHCFTPNLRVCDF